MESARKRMGRLSLLGWLVGVMLLLALSAPTSALADDCAALGGSIVAGECQVSGSHNASGSFTLDETLHILTGGKIITGAGGIDLTITSGDLIMEDGAFIDANVNAGGCPGVGGPITITLDDGDVNLKPGSVIRSNSCQGGAIVITNSAPHIIDIDGTVESVGASTGTGATQKPGGGPITIVAGCSLTVTDDGKVSSRGRDPGADLVHLEGCVVTIFGLVESTGAGHAIPNNPPNHCDNNAGAGGGDRPDKPANSTACVEIWSGTTVTIDSNPPHKGEVNANITGPTGTSWIDIYANGTINIIGDNTAPFAVHANMTAEGHGGLITIKSLAGDVIASGLAIQADNTHAGGEGGDIFVQAANNINFNTASIFARGDFGASGGFGEGGKLGTVAQPVQAFNGSLSWTSGTGDVRPTGSDVPLAQRGEINLKACGPVTLGATFPVNGAVVPPFPNVTAGCGGAPTVPAYVQLPAASCATLCVLNAKKSGQKFNDTAGDGIKDPPATDPPLPGWEIRVFDTATKVLVNFKITDGSGNYEFDLAPGSYTVCEVLQAGWTQTFPPALGGEVVDCAPFGAGLGPRGYSITLASGQNDTGNDFGNHQEQAVGCPQDPNVTLTRVVDATGAAHGGLPVHLTLQAAFNAAAAAAGEIIGMFSNLTESVTLNDAKTLKITQCTAARLTAANANAPVVDITSTGKITIVSLETLGGTIGFRVAGNGGHTLKSVRAGQASQFGILVVSNSNSVNWNSVHDNAVGVGVTGNLNTLSGSRVENNTGDGVQLSGNTNTLSNPLIQNNGGNGILVTGTSNVLKSNKTNSNTLDGIKTAASATGTKFNSNSSNTDGAHENGGAEYNLGVAGINSGGNKADGIGIPSAGKCPTFPAAGICE